MLGIVALLAAPLLSAGGDARLDPVHLHVSIGISEARALELHFAGREPVQVLDASFVRPEEGDPDWPSLRVVGKLVLLSGKTLAAHGRGILAGDAIQSGVFRNDGEKAVRVVLSSGTVVLPPGRGVFVGRYETVEVASGWSGVAEDGASVTLGSHVWKCECTCNVQGGTNQVVRFPCPGNRTPGSCSQYNGQPCETKQGSQGTLEGCTEILIPAT